VIEPILIVAIAKELMARRRLRFARQKYRTLSVKFFLEELTPFCIIIIFAFQHAKALVITKNIVKGIGKGTVKSSATFQ